MKKIICLGLLLTMVLSSMGASCFAGPIKFPQISTYTNNISKNQNQQKKLSPSQNDSINLPQIPKNTSILKVKGQKQPNKLSPSQNGAIKGKKEVRFADKISSNLSPSQNDSIEFPQISEHPSSILKNPNQQNKLSQSQMNVAENKKSPKDSKCTLDGLPHVTNNRVTRQLWSEEEKKKKLKTQMSKNKQTVDKLKQPYKSLDIKCNNSFKDKLKNTNRKLIVGEYNTTKALLEKGHKKEWYELSQKLLKCKLDLRDRQIAEIKAAEDNVNARLAALDKKYSEKE